MSGRVFKFSISLPPETMAQLDYLVEAWHMPPTVKRSQVIQQAIWNAYTDALVASNEPLPDCDFVNEVDDLL